MCFRLKGGSRVQGKRLGRPVIVLMVIYLIVTCAGLVINFQKGDMSAVGMGFVAFVTPWIVPFLFRLLHLHMTQEVWILDLVFVFFASVIGSCFGGYGVPLFDKALHFCSGFLVTTAGALIYQMLAGEQSKSSGNARLLFVLFLLFMDLGIAVLWEFFEYFMLVVFQNDCIHHYDSGVHDSMTDMLCAFASGLYVIWQFYRWMRVGREGFFVRLCRRFAQANGIGGRPDRCDRSETAMEEK